MPETDGGLQERVDHGPDLLLEKWPGPLCPHPQIQASADVRKSTCDDVTSSLRSCILSLHLQSVFVLLRAAPYP